MCKNCGNNSCKGSCSQSSGKQIAQLANEVQELKLLLNKVQKNTVFLEGGHPILQLQNSNDIALFNNDTGLGSKKWEGWAICNGATHYSEYDKADIIVPNLLDKFVVAAGDSYDVGDTGGSNEVTLTASQIPAHSHAINDPGHIHPIDDAGHIHGTVVGNHTHTITSVPHDHVVDGGSHFHALNPAVFSVNENSGTGPFGAAVGALVSGTNYGGLTTNTDGSHSHNVSEEAVSATASSESIAVGVSSANTGIEIESALTGITLSNTGGGEAHENRPPYYALLFVMKL